MNNKKRSIKAFTIIELLTVMAVSSIVITIGVLLYSNANKAFTEHDQDLKREYKLNAFYTLLNFNVFKSDSIKEISFNNYSFFIGEYELNLQVEEDELIFNEDTLRIKEGEFDFVPLFKSSKKVKRLNFKFLFDETQFNWGFEKRYGIIQIINQ